ncbi:aromatic ring-hydroxylating dioxygenase subunit alpha [Sphingosinithalassobacter portus]|uniref:aromatic ring-hydroxylating dioxygenase subunit alpha n=1 Tax=Stakelama portus TaxID=2676234 RepID=UPI000D6DD8DD|nr:aromatic ring-hydroxylating dioxygenase subunit alpha [Sphingosinithalassobacter portus]
MNYLRNAWYAAAWLDEIDDKPLARTFLEEPVVLFRDTSGGLVALADRCPHRFAPLSQGKIVGDAIQCPYHGLRFDGQGSCVYNYHGPVPKAAKVPSYPLMERDGLVWIWMGDPELADEDKLPDFGSFTTDSDYAFAHGYLPVTGNYQLVVDNLLDLTHGQFLHTAFGSPDSTKFDTRWEGTTVHANYRFDGEVIAPAVQPFWESESATCDRWADMRWEAPSNLYLEVGVKECGESREGAILFPATHFLTPESATSTHYFWMLARNRRVDDDAITQLVWQITDNAFRNEDEPMIAMVQERMAGQDFDDLKPIFLTTDRAAGRARQILKKLIDEERSSAASEPEAKSEKALASAK